MKQPGILLLLYIAIISTASDCKKPKQPTPDNPYGLPNATQTGANIFACRINGQNWVSGKGIYLLGGGVTNDTLFATGSDGNTGYYDRILIRINGGANQGSQYQIPLSSAAQFTFITNKTCLGLLGSNVVRSLATSGVITITKVDKNNKIISGLFNCKVPIQNCDTLEITDGRFDIKYN